MVSEFVDTALFSAAGQGGRVVSTQRPASRFRPHPVGPEKPRAQSTADALGGTKVIRPSHTVDGHSLDGGLLQERKVSRREFGWDVSLPGHGQDGIVPGDGAAIEGASMLRIARSR